MPVRLISNRLLLVLTVAAGQLICLLLVLGGFSRWLEVNLSAMLRREVLAYNRDMAARLADLLAETDLDDVSFGSAGWERLQRMIERVKLPNEGFMCAVGRDDGRLLCHPELRHNPQLRDMTPGVVRLEGPGLGAPIIDLKGSTEGVGGWARMPDGVHLIGVQDVPALGIKILAHQKEQGVLAAVARFVAPVRRFGWLTVVWLTVLVFLVTLMIVERYENRLARLNEGLEQTVAERTRSLLRTRDAVIFGLAKLAESRDDDTGRHLERVRSYVESLARELSRSIPAIDEDTIATLGLTSALHDIGKVGVPDAVLRKAGPLTPEERAVMEKHTTIGGDCLLALRERIGEDDFIEIACEIALAHHERWDGSGYPYGLAKHEIPLSARIVAVADVYDALTSERVYKPAMSHEQACEVIRAGSGMQFDPAVVAAFDNVCETWREIAERLNDGPPGRSGERAIAIPLSV